MAIGVLSPVAIQQFFDNNGDPLAGGLLHVYLAGTSTRTPVYADDALLVPLTNPVVLDAAGRAPELFLDALAYKQVLETAEGVELWSADHIVTPTALRSAGSQTSVTGPQHNLPVPRGLVSFMDFRNTADVTISGFAAGTPGQILNLRALGGGRVHLLNDNSGSALGNRLLNAVGSGPTSLVTPAGAAMYVYQEGTWILITHQQGAWIRVPYNAANFAAGGGWTVEAGDVVQQDYWLQGTSVLLTTVIASTTITGTPGQLVVGGWPYLARTPLSNLPAVTSQSTDAPSIWGPCFMNMNIGEALLRFSRTTFGNWAADPGPNVYVTGQAWVDVS